MSEAEKKKERKKPDIGDEWIHPITGMEYRWDGEFWRATGNYPYGRNPLDF